MVSDLRNIWQVTIVDSLPYIWPDDEISLELGLHGVKTSLRLSEPNFALDVVLCMWKDNKGVSHDMETIRSIGVGKPSTHANAFPQKLRLFTSATGAGHA